MPVRHYRGLVLIVSVLIIYGSLYPFHFVATPNYSHFFSVPPGRFGIADIVLNVFLYIPVGFLIFEAMGPRGRALRLTAGVIGGTLMSAAVELTQGFDPPRDSSLSDILTNGLGSLIGAFIAAAVPSLVSTRVRRRVRGVALAPAFLVFLWALFQLYPLLPDISTTRMARAITAIEQFSWFEFFPFAADWLAALLLFREALPSSRRNLAALLILFLPVKMILFQRELTGSEAAGALPALIVLILFARSRTLTTRVLPALLMVMLMARELAPFHFAALAAGFNWLPFGASLVSQSGGAVVILLRKAFVYGTAIWFLQKAGARIWPSTAAVSVLLLALEWAQRWLPGRSAEITDALVALFMGAVLALSAGEERPGVGVAVE